MGVWFLMFDESRTAALLVRRGWAVGDYSIDIALYIFEVIDEEMRVGCWLTHSLLFLLYHTVNGISFSCTGDCWKVILWGEYFNVDLYWSLDEDVLLDFYYCLNHPFYFYFDRHLHSDGFLHDDLLGYLNWHLNLNYLHHLHYLLDLHGFLHNLLNCLFHFHYFFDFYNLLNLYDLLDFDIDFHWHFHNHNALYFNNFDNLIGHLLLYFSDDFHLLHYFDRHFLYYLNSHFPYRLEWHLSYCLEGDFFYDLHFLDYLHLDWHFFYYLDLFHYLERNVSDLLYHHLTHHLF